MNYKRFLVAIIILIIIIGGMYFIGNNNPGNRNNTIEPNGDVNNKVEVTKTDGSEFLMDTLVRLRIHDEQPQQILDETFNKLRYLENIFSKTITESDVSKINSNAGQKAVEVSDDTYKLLEEFYQFAEKTNGVFDPTIGPLVSLWGIGTEDQQVPTEEEIQNTLKKVDYRKLELRDDNKVFLKEEGMSIDLGAIAKGFAADYVLNYFNEKDVDSAFINMGGNVSVHRDKTDDTLWSIGIQDPDQTRGSIIAAVEGEDMSVVTSGNYERYFTKDGIRYHHILNPETGYPAREGIISSTVISNNSSYADALSTSFYILGIEKSFEIAKSMEDINIVLVTKNDKVYVSEELKDRIRVRPALLISVSHLGDFKKDRIWPMAAAIEMIHLATLIHDDVIDKSSLRRGVKTTHHKYTNKTAIFMGDYLFALSMEIILEEFGNEKIDGALLRQMKNTIKSIKNLCEGEVSQFERQFEKIPTFKEYLEAIKRKTALLFKDSAMLGADLSGMKKYQVFKMGKLVFNMGMAFQMVDDLFDFQEKNQQLGKPQKNDFNQGIYTLPIIYIYNEVENKEKLEKFLKEPEKHSEEIKKLVHEKGGI